MASSLAADARARPGRGHGDERAADRHPRRAYRQRADRRGVRLAGRVRDSAPRRCCALAATLRRALPRVPPTAELSYGGLLRSVGELVREEPLLRQRMVLGALQLRLLQRAVDVARVPALRRSVPLRQRGHRPVRPGRRGRRGGGVGRRPARRPRLGRARRRPRDRGRCWSAGRLLAVGKSSVIALHRRDRAARPRRAGAAHLQPERDLRAAPRCPQPPDDRVHGRLLPRRRRCCRRSPRRSSIATAGAACACSARARRRSRSRSGG